MKKQYGINQGFSYYLCLMMECFGAGSVLVTSGSGCGSGRPTNIRILRIRIHNTGFSYVSFSRVSDLGMGAADTLQLASSPSRHSASGKVSGLVLWFCKYFLRFRMRIRRSIILNYTFLWPCWQVRTS